jgi:hypothetical protein
MKSALRRRKAQQGAALILFITVLVLGVAWYAIGAFGKAAPTTAEREIKTGLALQAAKQALMAYIVQYAARSDTAEPGQLPCPESVTLANPGEASSSCSNAVATVGRLPWKTLGIDQLRDGDGEPLWYVLSPGFRSPPINFANTGQLTYNAVANSAVALVIAPGRALNTLSAGTPPAGCANVNQQVATRNTASLNLANFLECGNATGSYVNLGTSQWTNDRVISITAPEWADAIAPAVADRLQRQVAAVLGDWDQVELAATGRSWAATHGISYLPFASNWGNPTTNSFCGNQSTREGLAPVAAGCENNPWTGSATVTGVVNLGCDNPTGVYLRCRFLQLFGTPPFTAQITATAQDVAGAFRSTISASDLTVTNGGSATLSMALSGANSDATATVNVTWPITLGVFTAVEVRIPHLAEAAALSDSRFTWFRNNNWHRYTYYAIAPGARAGAASPCAGAGDPDCLTATGLPASTGNTDDKRLVLVLSGRPLAGQSQPSGGRDDYYESDNETNADESFLSATTSTTFNDRVAACPFKHTDQDGNPIVICN